MARIRIDDLPVAEDLTPEQEALIQGAGLKSFRPSLEVLEGRQLMSAHLGDALPPMKAPVPGPADFSNAADTLAGQKVVVVNGVADVTQAARTTLESDILARLPRSLGSYPLVGEVTLDRVTLNRLTLDKDGNFNGQLSITFKYQMIGTQYASVQANIKNNQLSLDTDNALVRQFGKLDQRQQQWQPQVTAALDALRSRLLPQYFGTQASSANGGGGSLGSLPQGPQMLSSTWGKEAS
jgi:hypothetical protein